MFTPSRTRWRIPCKVVSRRTSLHHRGHTWLTIIYVQPYREYFLTNLEARAMHMRPTGLIQNVEP